MDANVRYDRFCRLVRSVAEDRIRNAPDFARQDWLCRCYQSRQFFDEFFTNPADLEDLLRKWEEATTDEGIAADIGRMNQEGITYAEMEALRHELPGPDEEPPGRHGP
jgi:hypothetical protein